LIFLKNVSNFFAKNLEPVDWADPKPEPTLSKIKCNIVTPFRPDKEGINIVYNIKFKNKTAAFLMAEL
jgi:hypothetical protein